MRGNLTVNWRQIQVHLISEAHVFPRMSGFQLWIHTGYIKIIQYLGPILRDPSLTDWGRT